MGAAVNFMLPRHAAIMLWLSFAFPLVWRKQALLASVYVAHLLLIIRLAAARGWPYIGHAVTPTAISVRLGVCSALSVVVAAAFDWREARTAAAARAAGKVSSQCDGTGRLPAQLQPPPQQQPSRAPQQQQQGGEEHGEDTAHARPRAGWLRGGLSRRRSPAPGTASGAAVCDLKGAAPGSSADAGADRRPQQPPASPQGSGGQHSGGRPEEYSMLAEASRRLRNLRMRRVSAPVLPSSSNDDGAAGVPTCTRATSSAASDNTAGAQQATSSPPHPSTSSPPLGAAGAASAALVTTPAQHAWPRMAYQPRPRYRSVARLTRIHVKMSGVMPDQLDPRVVGLLSEDLSERGFLMTDMAVRSGCIEVVLELEDACAHDGFGPEFIRRVVSVLDGAVRRPTPSAIYPVVRTADGCPTAASGYADLQGDGIAMAGGEAAGSAVAAAGGSGAWMPPVQVHVDGMSYLLNREPEGASGGDGWRIWRDDAYSLGADGGVGADGSLAAAAGADAVYGGSLSCGASGGWDVTAAGAGAAAAARVAAGVAPFVAPGDARSDTLLAVLPPCMALPPQQPSVSTPESTRLEEEVPLSLSFTLYLNRPHRHPAWLATTPEDDGDVPIDDLFTPECPDVLAWQRGCFLQVLSVEEVPVPVSEAEIFWRAYRVRLDSREASYGLVTIGIRAKSWRRGAPSGIGLGRGPLAASARVLLVPPSLEPLAEELQQPLSEDALSAVAFRDADGVQSVGDFLADLSEWLSYETVLLAPPQYDAPLSPHPQQRLASWGSASTVPLVAANTVGYGAAGAAAGSTCMRVGGSSSPSSPTASAGGSRCDSAALISRSLAMLGIPRGADGSGQADWAGRSQWEWSAAAFRTSIDEDIGGGTGIAGAHPVAGVAGAGDCALGQPRILVGGRMDLREELSDATRAVRSGANREMTQQRVMDKRHWTLLKHAVQCGWPCTVRLLLGLDEQGDEGGAGAGGAAAAGEVGMESEVGFSRAAEAEAVGAPACLRQQQQPLGRKPVSEMEGRGGGPQHGRWIESESISLLHLAVGTGVAEVVDAVVAANRYGIVRHPCGVYGTWTTLARSPGAAMAAITPLHVAAALPDGGALLAHILGRYPAAEVLCKLAPAGASASAAEVAVASGNAAALGAV